MSENPYEPPKQPSDEGRGMALLRLKLEVLLVLGLALAMAAIGSAVLLGW